MRYNNGTDLFTDIGIVDTRRYSCVSALRELHRTFCMMDSSQRKVLKDWFDSHESITDAVNQFAEYDEVFSEL